jgi:hypothetical protein
VMLSRWRSDSTTRVDGKRRDDSGQSKGIAAAMAAAGRRRDESGGLSPSL